MSEDSLGLLKKLGGWRRDRLSGKEGLTLAGLMMFGKEDAIQEAAPEYHLDYREYLSVDPGDRWTDRLTLDGTWVGNLFQFFLKVIQRLSADLKLPFQLDSRLVRAGETPVHVAIREALINALIHADYSGQGGIVVEKRRDGFRFTNPGTLLVSFEQFLEGGVSECRNKSLQKMFLMIGAAEKAGSGVDKIRQGWATQHWRAPRIDEIVQPDRVRLHLPTVSMIPEESLVCLRQRFGQEFGELNPTEVSALVTADLEGEVSNQRMRQISKEHSSDLTVLLQGLVSRGFLEQDGRGRWTTYHLPSSRPRDLLGSLLDLIDSPRDLIDSPRDLIDSPQNPIDSSPNVADTVGNPLDSGEFEGEGKAIWRGVPIKSVEELRKIAEPGRSRISAERLSLLILDVCAQCFLTKAQLAELLDRNPDHLYYRYLRPMVEEGLLVLKYPESRSRPGQAYKTAKAEDGS